MMISKFNKFKFLTDNLNENYADFNPYGQFGVEPHSLGAGFGFAVDTSISIFASQDSVYANQYSRTPFFINNLMGMMKSIYNDYDSNYGHTKYDQFLEDIENYKDFKILRLSINESLTIDVYISFYFNDEEYFGVYKKFNWIQKPTLKSDLFTDSNYGYIDSEYRLKLDNYLYKVLIRWFKPETDCWYENKSDTLSCRDDMGSKFLLPKNAKIKVLMSKTDKDGNSYIKFKYNDKTYVINKNDYYFFNYWFEKILNQQ